MRGESQIRILHLFQFLYRNTDEMNPASVADILRFWELQGICSERKQVYKDIALPIPIKASEYGHCMDLLSSLGIGDALSKDCQVEELTRAYPTLRCLEGCKVNIDELDYLAKRLDGFDAVEISQFQAMADKLKLTDMKDLINLTFSCQQATIIADFSDLESIGRAYYMNTHGGCASAEELENLDGEETAILLIEDNEGTVTRYGVVYDNGMQLSQLYDGKNLPC